MQCNVRWVGTGPVPNVPPAKPRLRHHETGQTPQKGATVDFEFVCGWCDADCIVYGQRFGFFGDKCRVPTEWECWACGGTNVTPEGPWTPAD